jgi:hypothetical protein
MPRDSDLQAALRDTIRARGTARLILLPLVFIGWAATAVATAAVITVALSTLVPLMVLVAGFEAIHGLHTSVQRIASYLESLPGHDPGTMAFMEGDGDPLFGRIFVFATSINYLPAALGGEMVEWVLLAVLHLAFVYRIRSTQARVASGRADSLAAAPRGRDDAVS